MSTLLVAQPLHSAELVATRIQTVELLRERGGLPSQRDEQTSVEIHTQTKKPNSTVSRSHKPIVFPRVLDFLIAVEAMVFHAHTLLNQRIGFSLAEHCKNAITSGAENWTGTGSQIVLVRYSI